MDISNPRIFIYGPPGSGKSVVGRALAQSLSLPFYDLDAELETSYGAPIPEIFARDGETGFRTHELQALASQLELGSGVIALGGGALLDIDSRTQVESAGTVLCLSATLETLLTRMQADPGYRPLLAGDRRAQLSNLLAQREAHYVSFPIQLPTDGEAPAAIAWQAQVRLGVFHVRGMGAGYDVHVQSGGLVHLGPALAGRGLGGPVALVCDSNVAELYAEQAAHSLITHDLAPHIVTFPAGEAHKTMSTVGKLWDAFLEAGLERGSTVVALGGGVTGDLAGFAAATFLRGVPWAVAPTTLLSMCDASLGGKTGTDLRQGKNLVGAFHPPRLVLADPHVLATLPDEELRAGLAEVIKAGIIRSPALFARCAQGWETVQENWEAIVRQAVATKIRFIETDPYERGPRAALNLGHTIGHALELASDYQLSHGEAVAIGLVVEAQLAEHIGIAVPGLAGEIVVVLTQLGLPTSVPPYLDRQSLLRAMQVDKKRARSQLRFALPERIGAVRVGVEVSDLQLIDEALATNARANSF